MSTVRRINQACCELECSRGIPNISRVNMIDLSRDIVDKWIAPPQGWYKLNSDAAWKVSAKLCSMAVLVGDCKGNIIDGVTQCRYYSNSLEGGAKAVMVAVSLSAYRQFSNVIFKSD